MGKGRRFADDKKTATTVALRVSTLALVNRLAMQRNVSRSELVEEALCELLRKEQQEEVNNEICSA